MRPAPYSTARILKGYAESSAPISPHFGYPTCAQSGHRKGGDLRLTLAIFAFHTPPGAQMLGLIAGLARIMPITTGRVRGSSGAHLRLFAPSPGRGHPGSVYNRRAHLPIRRHCGRHTPELFMRPESVCAGWVARPNADSLWGYPDFYFMYISYVRLAFLKLKRGVAYRCVLLETYISLLKPLRPFIGMGTVWSSRLRSTEFPPARRDDTRVADFYAFRGRVFGLFFRRKPAQFLS